MLTGIQRLYGSRLAGCTETAIGSVDRSNTYLIGIIGDVAGGVVMVFSWGKRETVDYHPAQTFFSSRFTPLCILRLHRLPASSSIIELHPNTRPHME